MWYSEFVMKMNPNCFAAISNRIDYCNIREVENTKFYCLKLVIQRREIESTFEERTVVSENLPSHYTLLGTISTSFFY